MAMPPANRMTSPSGFRLDRTERRSDAAIIGSWEASAAYEAGLPAALVSQIAALSVGGKTFATTQVAATVTKRGTARLLGRVQFLCSLMEPTSFCKEIRHRPRFIPLAKTAVAGKSPKERVVPEDTERKAVRFGPP